MDEVGELGVGGWEGEVGGRGAGDRRVGCGRGREQRGGEKFETEEGEKYEMDGEEVGKGNLPCAMRRQGSARLCTRRPISKPTPAMTVFLFIYRDIHMALAKSSTWGDAPV